MAEYDFLLSAFVAMNAESMDLFKETQKNNILSVYNSA